MKFIFRLQSVFELRKHLESEQKDSLGRERQTLQKMTEEKELLQADFELWSKKYLALADKGMSPIQAVRINTYLSDIVNEIKVASRNIEKQTANVERERLLLIEKVKERKTIEALYGKQREQFIYDEGKKEEKEIEELITSRR
ncbi:MAG TPA: flagellar export protein FliJ [Ruminiclostridium sp.]|nr:flagellar export protein FliJ [Ruminiclostridium sp.]